MLTRLLNGKYQNHDRVYEYHYLCRLPGEKCLKLLA